MSRIPTNPEILATPHGRILLQEATRQLGGAPVMVRSLAHSPAALQGYLRFRDSLESGTLTAQSRILIALAVSEINACSYCLSAHVATGAWLGLTDAEMNAARQCRSTSPKMQAILALVQSVVVQRGEVSTTEFFAARDAGLSHAELAEVVGHIALTQFTNYFNTLALTEVDFPPVKPGDFIPLAA